MNPLILVLPVFSFLLNKVNEKWSVKSQKFDVLKFEKLSLTFFERLSKNPNSADLECIELFA